MRVLLQDLNISKMEYERDCGLGDLDIVISNAFMINKNEVQENLEKWVKEMKLIN